MFFERFNELSKNENTSVNAVAKKLGISSGSVTAWKGGTEPSISAIIKIAKYFKVSIDYLIGLTNERVTLRMKNILWGREFQILFQSILKSCDDLWELKRYCGLGVEVDEWRLNPYFEWKVKPTRNDVQKISAKAANFADNYYIERLFRSYDEMINEIELSQREQNLYKSFDSLDKEGQIKVVDYADILDKSGEHKITKSITDKPLHKLAAGKRGDENIDDESERDAHDIIKKAAQERI